MLLLCDRLNVNLLFLYSNTTTKTLQKLLLLCDRLDDRHGLRTSWRSYYSSTLRHQQYIEIRVTTSSRLNRKTSGNVYLVNSTQKFVISDIDGTITRSNVRGWFAGVGTLTGNITGSSNYGLIWAGVPLIICPRGPWAVRQHQGLFTLQGRELHNARGPIFLRVDSIFNAFATEVIDGNPEVQKIQQVGACARTHPGTRTTRHTGIKRQTSRARP